MSENHEFIRLPKQHHHSLKAWNAADELIIKEISELKGRFLICNDAFGYLTCNASAHSPMVVTDLKSQHEAIVTNAKNNSIKLLKDSFFNLTDKLPELADTALLKIPKSNSLFETYLQYIHENLADNGQVYCGFMTKYFSKGMIKIAEKYFTTITQTKAEKKARVMILSDKKELDAFERIESFEYEGKTIQQYKGIFSGGKVDDATDYLLKNIAIPYVAESALDMASGNGIIGKWILENSDVKAVHFLDDSYLAIESSKLNVKSKKVTFSQDYQLNDIEDNSIDWIVSNPPFHFEHTIDISIPLNLFEQAYQKLKVGGTFTIVVNSNLGYEGALKKGYKSVKVLASDKQYKIYECRK
ncbi:MAG: class I SAM-dependent methyltransferase [Crocinitomicaceae bacterium]